MRESPNRLSLLTLVASLSAGDALADVTCRDTPEGRVCSSKQPIISLTTVSADDQRDLGLITIGTGCSATLLNRFWVLTAHHCLANGILGGPLVAPESVTLTAVWSTRLVNPSRIQSFVGVGPSGIQGLQPDVALLYLGRGDFGEANIQLLYTNDVTSEQITQFGQGLASVATGSFLPGAASPPVQASGAGQYRSAGFTPVPVIKPASVFTPATEVGFTWNNANPSNPTSNIGQGGDSGGPSIVTAPGGIGVGIAGVQSTCNGAYIPGFVPPPGTTTFQWQWAGQINSCFYAAINPIRNLIVESIQEGRHPCKDAAAACTSSELSAFLLLMQ